MFLRKKIYSNSINIYKYNLGFFNLFTMNIVAVLHIVNKGITSLFHGGYKTNLIVVYKKNWDTAFASLLRWQSGPIFNGALKRLSYIYSLCDYIVVGWGNIIFV